MSCPVLQSLSSSVAAVEHLPVPVGLGAEVPLDEQVHALAGVISRLQRELAIRMAARERADPRTSDVIGAAGRPGLAVRSARKLRRLGRFADEYPDVEREWRSGSIRAEQVELLHARSAKVSASKRRQLVGDVLPLLPGLDEKATRQVVEFAVDQLEPGDPDDEEVSEHAARRLAWSRVARGGLVFEGYLPAAEGAAFTTAIDALVESLRVAGDQLTPAQRRADALATLVATATQQGLPTGGGLPAAMTLTVSLTESARVALRDPARHGSRIVLRPQGPSTLNGQTVGDATVRFGVCCAAITPILTDQPGDPPERLGVAPKRPAGPPERPVDPAQRPGGSGGVPEGLGQRLGGAGARVPMVGSLLDRLARTPVQPLAV